MPQLQRVTFLRCIDIADGALGTQAKTMMTIGKFYTICGQPKVVVGPLVVKAHPSRDSATRQIMFQLHEGVDIVGDGALLGAGLEPRTAHSPKDVWPAAHRPHEPKNLRSLIREAPPDLRP